MPRETVPPAPGSPAPAGPPARASFLDELYRGRLRWDLMSDFPVQDPADEKAGDAELAEFTAFLRRQVDPTRVDLERRLPDRVLSELRERGYLRLMVDPELGGRGLSAANAFRLVQAAASWSSAVAFTMGIGNGFGSGAYLPLLGEGPLRELIRDRVASGTVSAGADAEPAGTANSLRRTTATLSEDGESYLLNGEKVFIGNGAIAGLMDVTATVEVDGSPQTQAFFVDTATPGFEAYARHDFMGLGGAPNAALRLTDVRVPRSHAFAGSNTELRRSRELAEIGFLARTLVIGAPALAIARLCLHWSREFVNRRTVDGRPLGSYQEVQRLVGSSLADVYAIESVTRWTLLGAQQSDTLFEHAALKNIASLTCWRVIDRTMGLLGGEGFETAVSKARRGADPLPVERFFRDARGLRVAGGVDFLLDKFAAQGRLTSCYYTGTGTPDAPATVPALPVGLSTRNREHARFATAQATEFGIFCRELVQRHPDPADLFVQEHLLITLGRIANELLAVSAVLARSAARPADRQEVGGEEVGGEEDAALLADLHCTGARHRLAALWPQLDRRAAEPDWAAASAGWLDGDRWGPLLDGVITTAPDAGPYAVSDTARGQDGAAHTAR